MKLRETLKNYGGFAVDVTTDEEIGDILVAIKYHDHGDEFLYIKTYSGEEYEYGYYLDRKYCCTDFDITKNSGESDEFFIKRPTMYADMTRTKVVEASNDIYFYIHGDDFGFTSRGDTSKVLKRDNAEVIFNNFIRKVNKHVESGVYYDFERYKNIALEFIEVNELGQGATNRLNQIKWNSLIDGCAGMAGKTKVRSKVYYDGLISVLYRGKNYDINKVTYRRDHEDWFGFTTYSLTTRQFQ